jgi:hypothetical protein
VRNLTRIRRHEPQKRLDQTRRHFSILPANVTWIPATTPLVRTWQEHDGGSIAIVRRGQTSTMGAQQAGTTGEFESTGLASRTSAIGLVGAAGPVTSATLMPGDGRHLRAPPSRAV